MEKSIYVYSCERGVRKLKPGVTLTQYSTAHFFAVNPVMCKGKPPSLKTLEKWSMNGVAKAIDGCGGVEPDGYCRHGLPSWLRALNYI